MVPFRFQNDRPQISISRLHARVGHTTKSQEQHAHAQQRSSSQMSTQACATTSTYYASVVDPSSGATALKSSLHTLISTDFTTLRPRSFFYNGQAHRNAVWKKDPD